MDSKRDIWRGTPGIASVVAIAAGCIVMLAGCSFDTAAGREPCSDDQEGTVRQGAVCEDGFWVPTDAGRTEAGGGDTAGDLTDAGGTETGTDPTADTGPDDEGDPADTGGGGRMDTCGADGQACVDTQSGCTPGQTRSCYTGPAGTRGADHCNAGTQTCREDGSWGSCEGESTPTEEVCGDQVDNDCDGTVDEKETCQCNYDGTSEGVCSNGRLDDQGDCRAPESYESSESSCSDGKDNDCDEEVDGEDDDCGDDEDERQGAGASCEEHEECLSRCIDGTCAHRIFVTSKKYDGDLGGLSGADSKCDDLAADAGKSGTWKAVMSDSNHDAKNRLTISGPVVRWDGKKVADGASDLWDARGRLDRPVEISEKGKTVQDRVWTGTNDDGTRDGSDEFRGEYCRDWTELKPCDHDACPPFDGEAGHSWKRDGDWLFGDPDPACDEKHRLYCIDGQ